VNSPSTAIALESVSKRYGSRDIIHDMSFSVQKGEIVGFLGPNGAGKTTTMRMIAGYTTATSGRVTVAGFDMATHNEQAARRIGYLPEQPPLYDVLEVAAYLRFVAKVKGVARPSIPAELDRVINACRLEAVVNREIYKLSKGYRQRVGLAQALLGQPEVLLLDEPTAGLDPGQIQETREVIRAFGAEHAVLLSTHILHEVTLICQRVAIINDGRLLAIDSPDGLQRASEQTNRVSLVVTGPADAVRDALVSIDGVRNVDIHANADRVELLAIECQVDARDGVEAAIARAVAARWSLHRLERQQPTLENIFLRYVGDTPGARNAKATA
jgi:ABC-2 type transport system ATP-binding protein